MLITIHVRLPGNRGYSLRFTDVRPAARAYSAERAHGGAEVTVEVTHPRAAAHH